MGCSRCQAVRTARKDGMVPVHRVWMGFPVSRFETCPGSGQPPYDWGVIENPIGRIR